MNRYTVRRRNRIVRLERPPRDDSKHWATNHYRFDTVRLGETFSQSYMPLLPWRFRRRPTLVEQELRNLSVLVVAGVDLAATFLEEEACLGLWHQTATFSDDKRTCNRSQSGGDEPILFQRYLDVEPGHW